MAEQNQLSEEDKKELEVQLPSKRVFELRIEPIQGDFDAQHLKAVHRHIFQDMEKFEVGDYAAGEYRSAVPQNKNWVKNRSLESIDTGTTVAYSRMDEEAQKEINDTLKDINPRVLSKLDTKSFTKKIGQLYSQLDYLHPFKEGNSRTLRAFTEQLAEESGYELNWKQFNQSEAGRDILYIARDLSVNKIAEPRLETSKLSRIIALNTDLFSNNADLPTLLKSAIKKDQSLATEKKPLPDVENTHAIDTKAFAEKYPRYAKYTAYIASLDASITEITDKTEKSKESKAVDNDRDDDISL